MLFSHTIQNWADWGLVYQQISAFTPLAAHIFEKANLPFPGLSPCTPGTNAVFSAGAYILKIFAPETSGLDSISDFTTERFGLVRANALGVASPKLFAHGIVRDAYDFPYLLMEKLPGRPFADALLAPPEYELAALVCELFCFEKPYLDGFFGAYDAEILTDRCFLGLLLHDFGQNMIRCNLGDPAEITILAALKARLRHAIETNSSL